MKKKALSLALALVVCLGLLPITARADYLPIYTDDPPIPVGATEATIRIDGYIFMEEGLSGSWKVIDGIGVMSNGSAVNAPTTGVSNYTIELQGDRGNHYYYLHVEFPGGAREGSFIFQCTGTYGGMTNTEYVAIVVSDSTAPPSWTVDKNCTILFHSNGGGIPRFPVDDYPYEVFIADDGERMIYSVTSSDGSVPFLPTARREGYTLDGWYTARTGGTRIEAGQDLSPYRNGAGLVELYAHWAEDAPKVEPVRVDFLPNGGTITQISGQKIPALSPGQPPITIDDGTGVDQNSGIAWTRTDKNGQIAGLPTVERKGYTFDGWYAVSGVAANQARDGALTDFSGCKKVTAVKFTESAELAAKWTETSGVCTVTFKINSLDPDLTDPETLRLKKGGEIELPDVPKWEGYTFQGWYSGTVNSKTHVLENAVEWEDGDKVTEDVTIYALWQENKAEPGASTVQPETPVPEVEDIPASGTSVASTQTVTVDGKAVEFQMYALLDANGNPTNYIKLRDMAYVLNGTKAQFAVGYDGSISLTTGQPYQAGGTEMTTPFSGDRAYTGGAQTVKINGQDVAMTAITLTDDNGGGYNYFKLRDLGKALGFNVSWNNGVIVESDKPYAG